MLSYFATTYVSLTFMLVASGSLEFWGLVATVVPPVCAAIGYSARLILMRWRESSIGSRLGRDVFSFSPTEIARSQATYVQPHCQSTDPGVEHEPTFNKKLQLRPLFEELDEFIAEGSSRFLFILGDSGTGKTSALINYFVRRYRGTFHTALVSLASTSADAHISLIENKAATTLLLDALDEDFTAAASRQRFEDILRHAEVFRKLVITCRTQFFASEAELQKLTTTRNIGPRGAGIGPFRAGGRIYLTPLSDRQLRMAIRRRIPAWAWLLRRRAFRLLRQAPRLMPRPMLVAYVAELAKQPEEWKYSYELYERIVDAWLQREYNDEQERTQMRYFLASLAVDIFERSSQRGEESIDADELRSLVETAHVKLTPAAVMIRSLLNRGAYDRWKFAHRSILEHLLIGEFWRGSWTTITRDWTDQMWSFFFERLNAQMQPPQISPPNDFQWLKFVAPENRQRLLRKSFAICSGEQAELANVRAALYLLAALLAPTAKSFGATLCSVTHNEEKKFYEIRLEARVGLTSEIAATTKSSIEELHINSNEPFTIDPISHKRPETAQILILPITAAESTTIEHALSEHAFPERIYDGRTFNERVIAERAIAERASGKRGIGRRETVERDTAERETVVSERFAIFEFERDVPLRSDVRTFRSVVR